MNSESVMREKKVHRNKIIEYFFSALIILIVVLLLLGFLLYFKIIPTPAFLGNVFDFGKEEVDSSYYDESEFYAFLQNKQSTEADVKTLHVNTDNAADFIEALKTCENFYWELNTVDVYKNNEASSSHSIWSQDGKMRADTVSQYQNTTVVIDGDKTVVRNNKNGDVRTFEGDTDFTFESVVNIADIEFYIDSSDSAMKEASLVNTETEKYLCVVFENSELGKTDEFYISLDYGIVLFAVSYIDGEKVFTQTTKDFRPDYQASSDIFKI